MPNTLETELGIIPVTDAITKYQTKYPDDNITKLQIEYEGPFLKYEFVGDDGKNRHTYEFNARTEDELKDKTKTLKRKHQDENRRARRKLDVDNLRSLQEITDIALEQVPVEKPFEWELDRKGKRTVWEIEIANETGDTIYEVKVDAHDGTVVEMKLDS